MREKRIIKLKIVLYSVISLKMSCFKLKKCQNTPRFSFCIPIPLNFATKLQNTGKDVDFLLAWNRPHSGDYALDELFQWIAEIVAQYKN